MENKQTVLIVDDIADNLNIVANILIPQNINVLIAQSGKEALSTVKKVLPDLILLDIMMPEMDGFEVCQKLKTNDVTKNIPVIFLSVKNEKASIIKGFKIGAVDFISKPFFEPELIARVKTHLEFKYSKDELKKHKNALEDIVAYRTNELEVSRNNFKNIFNSSSDAIFITDFEGNFIEFNDVTLKRLGISEDELLALNQKEFHQLQGNQPINNYFENIINTGENVFSTHYINSEEEKIYIELSGTTIIHKNKNAILHVSRDITKRQKAEGLKLKTIIQTEEKERERFAKDLHDGLGAKLSAAKMFLNIEPKSEEDSKMLKKAIMLIDDALKVAKEIAVNIRPHDLSIYGLVTSLNNFCKRLDSLESINVIMTTNNFNTKLNEEVELNIFRTINELINNTLKYANAKNIKLKLYEKNYRAFIEYTDDGKGFDYNKHNKSNVKGTGLDNIIYRAKLINGEVEINSEPGKGMSALITIEI